MKIEWEQPIAGLQADLWRQDGASYAQLGHLMGVTGSRAQQIHHRFTVPLTGSLWRLSFALRFPPGR